jgi:hypothetical protein
MHALMHAVVEREIVSARFVSATRRARVNEEAATARAVPLEEVTE